MKKTIKSMKLLLKELKLKQDLNKWKLIMIKKN